MNTKIGDADFEDSSANFLEWFRSSKGTRLSERVKLADLRYRGAGRGLIAVSDIEEDDELFAIPPTLLLDTANSGVWEKVPEEVASFGIWDSLIVAIIYQYLKGEASPWFHYFAVLPTTFDTLMFWTPSELEELQGSAVKNKIGKAAAEEKWKTTIVPFMQRHSEVFPVDAFNSDRKLLELAHMAGSLIMAYAFDIGEDDSGQEVEDGFIEDDEADPHKALVPFADMLNADANQNNARLFQTNGMLSMKATKSISAGDEILNDYGSLPRCELVRMYGYCTDNYGQYDVAELSADLVLEVAEDLRKKYKKPRKKVPELDEDGFVIIHPSPNIGLDEAIEPELHSVLRSLTLTQSHTRSFSFAECDLLKAIVLTRLGTYRTTLEEDKALLDRIQKEISSVPDTAVKRSRLQMALEIRMGEKEILTRILQLIIDYNLRSRDGNQKGSKKRKHGTQNE